ncbi:S-methyl-5-thioribose-1-phosphate isomerase [Chloroflexus sp. Y-396-1]|uniref:S-methyl-5-thioribose-1-phosphate isomerase n=1 Tax=Chloroflexus sp. Y-396-1 TaxID=867845 RepID=UPI000490FE74|nr:S-methyl-5-thioribose-1-phosphate isomerase [Chloroflexus sp. Y-396-1]
MTTFRSIEWQDNALRLLDQRKLPAETVYLELRDPQMVAEAIRTMVVRGAPAIGAAAAYGLALAALHSTAQRTTDIVREVERAAELLRASRPTAVNLFWAIQRVMDKVRASRDLTPDALRDIILREAHAIAAEDIQANKQIGLNAQPLIPNPAKILHHCNTGSLATVDYGTALGIIRIAHESGKQVHAYLDETRPRLQGAKLSAWELNQLGIPHTVIVDGASGFVMRKIGIDLCVVGADRIAANGDTANKIGTYNLALVAKAHGVPFYVAAPTSTIDMSIRCGDDIPIEERDAEEITHVGAERVVPEGSPVLNYAFDVTPADLITAIITEKGVAYPPFTESLPRLMGTDNR